MPSSGDQLFAEDLTVGMTLNGATHDLDGESFRRFAELTGDDHPIHYDPEYAANTRFGRCVAHGLLLMSMTALGATPVSRRFEDSMIALVAQECRFMTPGFTGDRVTSEFEVASVEMKLKRAAALVRFAVRLVNAGGDTLLEGSHTYLIRTRGGGAD